MLKCEDWPCLWPCLLTLSVFFRVINSLSISIKDVLRIIRFDEGVYTRQQAFIAYSYAKLIGQTNVYILLNSQCLAFWVLYKRKMRQGQGSTDMTRSHRDSPDTRPWSGLSLFSLDLEERAAAYRQRARTCGSARNASHRETSHNEFIMQRVPFRSAPAPVPHQKKRFGTHHIFWSSTGPSGWNRKSSVSLSPACRRRPLGVTDQIDVVERFQIKTV